MLLDEEFGILGSCEAVRSSQTVRWAGSLGADGCSGGGDDFDGDDGAGGV